MEKVSCFRISGVDLFLEQTLVKYNNVPIFFVCSGNEERYLVLCTDVSECNYIVMKITTERLCDMLSDMLSGECTMRDVFLKQSCFWEVHSGEDVARDHVKEIHQVKEELLPEENAFFRVLYVETASYAEKIRCEKGGIV